MARNIIAHLRSIDDKEKTKVVDVLIRESTGDFDFYVFVILSVLMASLGLIANNAAVVIGSMLLAPILFPILSIALSVIMSDGPLITRSSLTFLKASVVAVAASALATLIFSPFPKLTEEILLRANPSLEYAGIAIIAGIAASYALARPNLSITFPGIAVSVALIPPLAGIGIGIASLDLRLTAGAFTLYIINVLGIIFASMLVFSLMDLHAKKPIAKKVVAEEENRISEEVVQEAIIVDEEKNT